MPRLSDTMEEGTVATWFKKVGDTVKEGDILAEIETDKATMEFEAFYEGELLHIGIHEGETAPVDSLLAIIGEKGEDISAHLSGGTPAAEAPAPTEDQAAPAQETTEQALINNTPLWNTIAFALGVFGGSIGCVGLLMRKAWSMMALLVSLVAVVAQMTYWLYFTTAVEVYGNSTYVMPIIVILVAYLLFRLSNKGIKKGYLV